MYVIVGLGNPGRKYQHTRHNVGFDVTEVLSQKYDIPMQRLRCKAVVGEGTIRGQRVALCQPQTFMNLSGEAVREVVQFYKIPSDHVLVIYDDISLPVGKLRVRPSGSAGGHNGIKNIIAHLGTQEFPRVKIGVGAPAGGGDEMIDWVIGAPSQAERKILAESFEKAIGAAECIIQKGCQQAMNSFN